MACLTCRGSDHLASYCHTPVEDVCFSSSDYIVYPHLKQAGFRWSDPNRTSTPSHLLVAPKTNQPPGFQGPRPQFR